MEWPKKFKYDPVKPLIESDNPAVFYFTQRDYCSALSPLLQFHSGLCRFRSGLSAGRNPADTGKPRQKRDYYLIETFKLLQTLVYQYEFDKKPSRRRQRLRIPVFPSDGRRRLSRLLGNQYAPYYNRHRDGASNQSRLCGRPAHRKGLSMVAVHETKRRRLGHRQPRLAGYSGFQVERYH